MQGMHVELSSLGRQVRVTEHSAAKFPDKNNDSLKVRFGKPCNMSLSDVSREYFWGCELTKENSTFTWTFEEEEDDSDFLIHTLFLKQAVLGSSAVKDERNLVEVETKNFENKSIKHPIVSLTLGRKDMATLDLSFGHQNPVVFKLAEGSGPIHILAQQLVEFPDEKNDSQMDSELETEESQEESEDVDEEDEEEEVESDKLGKGKRKARAKKAKDEEEEDMEDDDEEDEDEEMEEDESSPEKSKKKKADEKSKSKKAETKMTKIMPKKAKSKKGSGISPKKAVKA